MHKVFWMKEYPRDSIPSILKNASLLVLPRPASKQAQGGFPTKLGEYLATGNPVCSTTVGEISDYLVDGESVYFAEPGSVESFAGAMERALSDPIKAREVGLNGRKVAEKYFNKDIQAKILYDFLMKILQEKA
jgi:glycosyltransferase involved in cell wall biosynthesis